MHWGRNALSCVPKARQSMASAALRQALIQPDRAHLDFPTRRRTRIHSTSLPERLNKAVKRRADVVGIFPTEGSIVHPIGAVLLEANDEWQTRHRTMQTGPMAEPVTPITNVEPAQIATVAA